MDVGLFVRKQHCFWQRGLIASPCPVPSVPSSPVLTRPAHLQVDNREKEKQVGWSGRHCVFLCVRSSPCVSVLMLRSQTVCFIRVVSERSAVCPPRRTCPRPVMTVRRSRRRFAFFKSGRSLISTNQRLLSCRPSSHS